MDDQGNADEVRRWLEQFVLSFNFTRPGVDRSMGRDLANLVAGEIADRSSKGYGPDGVPWERNSDRPSRKSKKVRGSYQVLSGTGYLTRKRKAYGWPEADGKPNYRTGQMLSHASLIGLTHVRAFEIEMIYGTDLAPNRTYSPIDNRTRSEVAADRAVTDTTKADYAVENGRPFYELDDNIREVVLAEAARLLSEYIAKEG